MNKSKIPAGVFKKHKTVALNYFLGRSIGGGDKLLIELGKILEGCRETAIIVTDYLGLPSFIFETFRLYCD